MCCMLAPDNKNNKKKIARWRVLLPHPERIPCVWNDSFKCSIKQEKKQFFWHFDVEANSHVVSPATISHCHLAPAVPGELTQLYIPWLWYDVVSPELWLQRSRLWLGLYAVPVTGLGYGAWQGARLTCQGTPVPGTRGKSASKLWPFLEHPESTWGHRDRGPGVAAKDLLLGAASRLGVALELAWGSLTGGTPYYRASCRECPLPQLLLTPRVGRGYNSRVFLLIISNDT